GSARTGAGTRFAFRTSSAAGSTTCSKRLTRPWSRGAPSKKTIDTSALVAFCSRGLSTDFNRHRFCWLRDRASRTRWATAQPTAERDPAELVLPPGHERAQFVERLRADALHLVQIVHAVERLRGARRDDRLRHHRPHARQPLEFVRRRGVHVDRRLAN